MPKHTNLSHAQYAVRSQLQNTFCNSFDIMQPTLLKQAVASKVLINQTVSN